MASRLKLMTALRTTERDHWKHSFYWLGYMLVGGLMPLWGGAILFQLPSKAIPLTHLVSHGELALYSAALVAPMLYVVVTERHTVPFPGRSGYVLVGLIVALSAAVLFAGVTILGVGSDAATVAERTVITWSATLFLISVVYAFLVTLTDNVRLGVNPRVDARFREENLESQFNEMESDDD